MGTPDAPTQAQRLLDLATAAEGQGRRPEVLDLLEQAFATAGVANDTHLMVAVASRCAFAAGWDSGERRAAAMLHHVTNLDAALREAARLTSSSPLSAGPPATTPVPVPTVMPADLQQLLLTGRQCEVLTLMAHGLTNRAIAEQLGFSVSTIRMETMSIYRKLGVKRRAEAVALLVRAEATH